MEYLLVLQFKASDEDQFEWYVTIQEDLEGILGKMHFVDGNDFGGGKMNIYIFTPNPSEALGLVKDTLYSDDLNNMVAAYREVEGEDFSVIWPEGKKLEFSQ